RACVSKKSAAAACAVDCVKPSGYYDPGRSPAHRGLRVGGMTGRRGRRPGSPSPHALTGGVSVLDPTDLQDILNGSCILGCGGGGPYTVGPALIRLLAPNSVQLVDVSDVEGDEQARVAGAVGAMDTRVASVPPAVPITSTLFTGALEGQQQTPGAGEGKPISYVIPFEIGAGNSFVPMVVAAAHGLRVV